MQLEFPFMAVKQFNYVVWVGAVEVTPYMDSAIDACRIADLWRDDGYDDVFVQTIEGDLSA